MYFRERYNVATMDKSITVTSFDAGNRRYMPCSNGYDYGRAGIGLAVLESDR